MKRRTFIKISAATASALALSPILGFSNAYAAETNSYKALVCVFLFGGMDNYDTILPYDQSEYDSYASIRQSLLNDYKGARDRENLLELQVKNISEFSGRAFALPSELQNIHRLFNEGKAAIIGNVGPLLEPITRNTFDEEALNTPKRLFSHNDQQATWMSNSPEGSQYGWGGAFCDAINSFNSQHSFSAITTGGSELYLSGQITTPFQISPSGTMQYWLLNEMEENGFTQALKEHLSAINYRSEHTLVHDMISANQNGASLNEIYNDAVSGLSDTSITFPETELGEQLKAVAKSIKANGSLGVLRQTFIVSQGGYDTHDAQATNLPALQQELDEAINAFYLELEANGLENQVTLFTASEFGRTLSVNGDGTDHGWGGHQFVLGGAVEGGMIYGDMPPIIYDHEYDAGDGRLIPSLAIEQYAVPLGEWLGVSQEKLNEIFPNLSKFSDTLNLMKG